MNSNSIDDEQNGRLNLKWRHKFVDGSDGWIFDENLLNGVGWVDLLLAIAAYLKFEFMGAVAEIVVLCAYA